MTTTVSEPIPSHSSSSNPQGSAELCARYRWLLHSDHLGWPTHYRKLRLLGKGGQGVVFLNERQGTDGFTLPVALKYFSPEHYPDEQTYRKDMARVARVAGRVAQIQHDNLLSVYNFVEQDGIRLMEMEWLDGYDLRDLLSDRTFTRTQARLSPEHWGYVGNVILTAGPVQPRFKPGVAIQVLRDCLAGLAALHREGVTHGDIKPSNVMLKRTGSAKLIDIGSSVAPGSPCARRMWSPAYAAPEVLRGGSANAASDLASLGYVLIEMLAGQSPFQGLTTTAELLQAKATLEVRLIELLPEEVSSNELLLHLCRRLVTAEPARRFESAQAADLGRKGAAAFHRHLVKTDLASEYDNDLRVWLEQLD